MEDRLDMATRRRLTNRFKDEYAKASKKDVFRQINLRVVTS